MTHTGTGNNKQKPPISDKSMLYIHKIVLMWLIVSLFMFFVGHAFSLNLEVLNYFSKKLWFVEDMAIASRFTEGTRLQWLFLTLSWPIITIFLLYKINDVKHGDMKVKVPIFMASMITFAFFFIFIEKESHLETQHGYSGIFLNSMGVASIMSFVTFYVLMLSMVYCGLYIKAYMKKLGD